MTPVVGEETGGSRFWKVVRRPGTATLRPRSSHHLALAILANGKAGMLSRWGTLQEDPIDGPLILRSLTTKPSF